MECKCQVCGHPGVEMFDICQECGWENDFSLEDLRTRTFHDVSYVLTPEQFRMWSAANSDTPEQYRETVGHHG